jgi:hypothetical protein
MCANKHRMQHVGVLYSGWMILFSSTSLYGGFPREVTTTFMRRIGGRGRSPPSPTSSARSANKADYDQSVSVHIPHQRAVPISIAAAAAQNKKPIATAMSFKKRAREAECSEVASDRVSLNVGGMVFETSVTTLTGTSLYFAHHFSGVWKTMRQVFLDLDQDSFKVLLSCMRHRTALLPRDDADLFRRVLLDAEFLGCEFLLTEVKETVQRNRGKPAPVTAQSFDADYGTLADAFRAGALPKLFFGPPSEPIRQILPAGEHDRLDLMSSRSCDGPIVKRVIAYALVGSEGTQRIEPVIAHHMDEEYHMGNSCTLASEFEDALRQHQSETALMSLGVSRYPPTTIGNTARSAFEHKIVEETPGESLADAIHKYGSKGYRAISTWTDQKDRLKILFERAVPQRAAAT